jgi:hypothetical protein
MTELRHFIGAGTLLVAVTACAAAPDEPGEDLAGGQSGTDAFGSGTCVLDPSSAFEMDFQDVIDWLEVTPQRLSNLAQGSRILSSQGCERDDFVYLDVRAMYSTQVVPGELSDGAGYCEAVDIEVDAHLWSQDGSVDARSSRMRFFPMRVRPLGDMVLSGTSLVQVHFDFQDFSQKTQSGDEYVVRADVYASGEVDQLGLVIPDDPSTGKTYLDKAPSCE